MDAIHARKIIHQDLKLENFLLFDQGKTLKIADFGMFTDLNFQESVGQSTLSKSRLAGTLSYMAPESHAGRTSYASDVFSLMVSAFIMVFGFAPFSAAKATDKHYKMIMVNNLPEYVKSIKKASGGFFDSDFMDLFLSCVCFQADKRLSLSQIASHAWLKGVHASEEEAVSTIASLRQWL